MSLSLDDPFLNKPTGQIKISKLLMAFLEMRFKSFLHFFIWKTIGLYHQGDLQSGCHFFMGVWVVVVGFVFCLCLSSEIAFKCSVAGTDRDGRRGRVLVGSKRQDCSWF